MYTNSLNIENNANSENMLNKTNSVTTEDFFKHVDTFIDHRKDVYEISDQTIKSNTIDLHLFENFIKQNNYETITGPAVIDFQTYLKKERNNSGGSINRKIFTLRSYASFLKIFEVKHVETLPFNDVLKIRQGYRNQPDALTNEQIKTLFDGIDRTCFMGIRDYAVYALMYGLGLRVGEVHGLNLEDIDLKKKKITVNGKGNRQNILPIKNEMENILTEWLAVRNNFLNSDQDNALFISKKGHRLAIRTMEDNFKKLVQKANLNTRFNVSCHTLRHSFASLLNEKNVDILVLQSLLGHLSARSTEVYIHPSERAVRAALEKLPGVIYMNQLEASGRLILSFQSKYRK